jgi:aspartyl-tRNA(Asn)/glutamyl-tRNA(Gln) amidotransferase subunit A
MPDLFRLDIRTLQKRLRDGDITAVDLLDHYAERIEGLNPGINALIAADPTARLQAEASAKRYAGKKPLGPLDGIPCTVKDNIPMAGLACTLGSPAFRDYRPTKDETAVARLRAAGAVLIGKTNIPEFCVEGYCSNALFGTTGNPWNPALTPGGSSGGAVAGIAAGLWPLAIGTDGGGSIRRPAGHTGLVGLKPTIGRVARVHLMPQLLLDMEVVGPLARRTADAAALFKVIAGPDRRDPLSRLPTEPGADQPLDQPPPAMRILYVEHLGDAPLASEIASSLRIVADRLADLGHEVIAGVLPLDTARLDNEWTRIGQAGLAALRTKMGEGFADASAPYQAMADKGDAISAADLYAMADLIHTLRREAAALFENIDIILTPSAAAQPWPADERFPETIDGQTVGPRGHAIYTGWVNAIGHPAITLPAASAPDGMPIGAQLVGAWNRDWRLLRFAHTYEQVHPFADRWPAITLKGRPEVQCWNPS